MEAASDDNKQINEVTLTKNWRNYPIHFRNIKKSIRSWTQISVELPVFTITFSYFLSSYVYKNEVLRLTCEVVYGYNGKTCKDLEENGVSEETKAIEQIIEPYSATIYMVKSLTEGLSAGVIGLLLGSWSDRFGRKPVMLGAIIGFCMMHSIMTVFSFFNIHPWIYALIGLPFGLVGGMCIFYASSYCYVADISTPEQRPFKLIVLSGAIAIGVLLSSICSNLVYKSGSTIVFAVCTMIAVITFAYVKIFIDESLSTTKLESMSRIRSLFQSAVIKELWNVIIKKRENYARFIMITCILSLSTFIFTQDDDVMYLFTRQKFLWSTKEYTAYTAASVIVIIIGGVVGIFVLKKILKLSMAMICLVGLALNVIDYFIKAFAKESWELYLALGVTMGKSCYLPIARAILSNVVSQDEIGKVYTLTTAVEFIIPVGSSPFYTLIYNSTFEYFPGAFILISSAAYLVCFVLFLIVYLLQKRGMAFVEYKTEI